MNHTKQIESTGHHMTIPEREEEARRHFARTLARVEQQCRVLGHTVTAEHCHNAIDSLGSLFTNHSSVQP